MLIYFIDFVGFFANCVYASHYSTTEKIGMLLYPLCEIYGISGDNPVLLFLFTNGEGNR